jgi:LuxR family maltose regulon positive regulatory protein
MPESANDLLLPHLNGAEAPDEVLQLWTTLSERLKRSQALLQQIAAKLEEQVERAGLDLRGEDPSGARAGGQPAEQRVPELRLCLFGQFTVRLGKRTIPHRWGGKGVTMLKYLAGAPRRRVHRDVLLEVVWPGVDPRVANNRLKVVAHHLRQICAPDPAQTYTPSPLQYRDGWYMLGGAVPVWTDVEAFEGAWRAGLHAEKTGRRDEARASFGQMERLYRGDYLEEDPYEEWTLLRREELKDLYLAALEKLAAYREEAGEIELASETWSKILAKDPYREDVYRRLMLCSAKRGNRGRAHYWYQLCARLLREHLQVEPEPETTELALRILQGRAFEASGIGSQRRLG